MPTAKKKSPSQASKFIPKEKSSVEKKIETKEKAPKGKSSPKTRIVVKYDCGFGNKLSIRGEGVSSLSWEKGVPLKNLGTSEWVWETDRPFSVATFKILFNDKNFEQGENHVIGYGQESKIIPQF